MRNDVALGSDQRLAGMATVDLVSRASPRSTAEGVDVTLRMPAPRDSELVSRTIGAVRMVLVHHDLTAVREDVPLEDVVVAHNVTTLLRAWCERGDHTAFDKIWPLIYDEMQRLAGRLLQREQSVHTLPPSALIHEAYLRLARGMQLEFKDRAHFFAIAAQCMRRILIDRARRRRADKRGSGNRPTVLDENCIAIDRSPDLVALDDALVELAKHSERKARVVELHYFGGLTQDEIAAVCEVHVNTVARDLRFSEAWLRRHLAAT